MILIDMNVLIALCDRLDPHHRRAYEELPLARGRTLQVHLAGAD